MNFINELWALADPYLEEACVTFLVTLVGGAWKLLREKKAVKELLGVLDKSPQHNQDLLNIAVNHGLKLGVKKIGKLLK